MRRLFRRAGGCFCISAREGSEEGKRFMVADPSARRSGRAMDALTQAAAFFRLLRGQPGITRRVAGS